VGTVLLLGGILFLMVSSYRMWKQRRHPLAKGLALGGIVALVGIMVHSITDFNLHIPANMVLFTVILALTMVTSFYKRRKE
jgi:phosphatidylserine synthase